MLCMPNKIEKIVKTDETRSNIETGWKNYYNEGDRAQTMIASQQLSNALWDFSSLTREIMQPYTRSSLQYIRSNPQGFQAGLWDSINQVQQNMAATVATDGLAAGAPFLQNTPNAATELFGPQQQMGEMMSQMMQLMTQLIQTMMTMMQQTMQNNNGNNNANDGGNNNNKIINNNNNNNNQVNPGVDGLLEHANRMVGLDENRDTAAIQKITGESGINPATTPWCAAWAMNMLKDHRVLNLDGLSNRNYCPTIKSWAQGKGIWEEGKGGTPKPGDAILFDWNGDNVPDHIGIVEKVEGGKVYTIEGNSSDKVSKRSYALNDSNIDGYLNT